MKVLYRCASGVLCALMLLTLLCGCGNKASTPTVAANGVDYNQYLNCPGYYACTDSAWYVCTDNNQIYFLDAGLESPLRPLCAKADCNHNNREICSSFLPRGAFSIYGWNNTLYYFQGSMEHGGEDLYQMALDGQNRKKLTNYFSDDSNYSASSRSGGGHVAVWWDRDTVNGDVSTLYLLSLEDYKAEPIVLYSNASEVEAGIAPEEQSNTHSELINEDWVFYSLTTGPAEQRSTALYGYQIATGETKLLIQEGFSLLGDLSQQGDTLYWYDTDGESYGRLNRIDLNSGEISRIRDFSIIKRVYGTLDDRYLYLLGGEEADTAEVVVYDLEGNELLRLSCAELGTPLAYAFSSADKVVFRSNALGEITPICWLDKDQLAKGKAAFHSIVSGN